MLFYYTVYRSSFLDYSSMMVAILGVCMPSFFIALSLQLVFSMYLGIFPVFGKAGPIWTMAGFKSMVLPSLSLGIQSSALLARLTRSNMLEVLGQDYIRTARAKGLKNRKVITKHAVKNAMIPVITMFGLQFGYLLGGAFITETIFALPGVGRYSINAIFTRDLPIIQSVALMMAVIFTFANLITDLIYALLDPRIKYN